MSLVFKFTIEEAPDAKSFILTDTTGNYHASLNPTGWGAPNAAKTDVAEAILTVTKVINDTVTDEVIKTYNIDLINYPVSQWLNGIELDYTTGFEDGAYDFAIELNIPTLSDTSSSIKVGFYAVIKDATMVNLMTYNQFLPKKDKEIYWEKTRLLDNLFYSTQTNQILRFEENLEQLERLE